MSGNRGYAERIVCMTEETTETLYALGEEDRIVGISGFTVRPPRARREKPRVSAFTSAKIDRILALEPDLVLGFSDLQADIAADLIRRGVDVHVFNHRSVAGIFKMIRTVGALVGAAERGDAYASRARGRPPAEIRAAAARFERRPRVYFEEWDDPPISGIRWVSELVEHRRRRRRVSGAGRRVAGQEPDNRRPVGGAEACTRHRIVGSWCGKKFRPERVRERPGWDGGPRRAGTTTSSRSSQP